jgi:RNA polymerase sigma-70 factor (ECF subfamily)
MDKIAASRIASGATMHEEPTTVVIQRYLDALPGDTTAEPIIRELLERATGRLRFLCATFLYKSYPRLTRPPLNLESEELLGGVVAGLLTAMRATRPPTVRRLRPGRHPGADSRRGSRGSRGFPEDRTAPPESGPAPAERLADLQPGMRDEE